MQNKKTKATKTAFESYDHQTKMSWATLLTTLKDVPSDFSSFFESLSLTGDSFPYALITPSYEGFVHRTQPQLVCLIEDKLYVANKNESVSQALCVKFSDIQYIEFGTVLLDSNLHIKGIDQNGQWVLISLRFNTVSDNLFKKIINAIRQFPFTSFETMDDYSYEHLKAANLKMSNFTRYCILAGEKVIHLVWQPELRKSRIKIHIPLLANSILYQTIFPNHVTVLTDKELILIHETERIVHNDRYGGVWKYIPLEKIKTVGIALAQDGNLILEIGLFDDQKIETQYLPSLKPELEKVVELLNL